MSSISLGSDTLATMKSISSSGISNRSTRSSSIIKTIEFIPKLLDFSRIPFTSKSTPWIFMVEPMRTGLPKASLFLNSFPTTISPLSPSSNCLPSAVPTLRAM